MSIETARQLDRAETLSEIPAALRFLSAEPLLGPLADGDLWRFDWVIVGGESGPRARPMELQWAREIRDTCFVHAIPFFLKQLGGITNPRAHELAVLDGHRHTEMPAGFAAVEEAA